MNTTITTQPALSVIDTMAARFGMERRAFEATLKATVVPANVSTEQFCAFLLVAKEYDLNPLTKEIYAFPAKSGGIQPIVSVDGWAKLVNRQQAMDGMEFEDHIENEKLKAITCRLYRKDRAKPIECTEYMSECNRDTVTWKQWPARMLRHKALIQCARYAFGFSGIVDPDEAERLIDITPVNTMGGSPTGPTTGTVTAKQVYGSSRAMKDKHKEIVADLNKANDADEVDAVEAKYAVDYKAMESIDPQLSADLHGVATRRKQFIASNITDVPTPSPVPAFMKRSAVDVEDGGLTEEEMKIWEEERATLHGRLGA